MRVEKHQVVGAIGVVAAFVAIYVMGRGLSSASLAWGVLGAATVVAGVGIGYAQYVSEIRSDNERHPIFDSAPLNVAFMGAFYVLSIHSMGVLSVGTDAAPKGPVLTAVIPGWIVVVVFVTMFLLLVSLGGVNRNLSHSYWVQAYCEGKNRSTNRE